MKTITLITILALSSCANFTVSGSLRDENTGAKAVIGGGKWRVSAPIKTDGRQTGYLEVEGNK